MLSRIAACTLLLLLPPAAPAQELDRAFSALVRISGTRGGPLVRGSGFVVNRESDWVTIVTAAHVVEGVEQLTVVFAADPEEVGFAVGGPIRMEAGDAHGGLAVFAVRGAIPARVTALGLDATTRPAFGTPLFLLGFPQMSPTPRTAQRVLSARSGTLLLLDQDVGEGLSGGPVLLGGQVVGVITDTDPQTTYAVNAVVVREALEGWGVKVGGGPGQEVTPPEPPRLGPCVASGEESAVVDGMTFVRLCGGSFTMGSTDGEVEKPVHKVTLSEFWIGKTEVTNEQYRWARPDHPGDALLPVVDVGWTAAQAACKHFGGRLPTEAEWEYAARAGSATAWSFGDEGKRLGEYAWFGELAGAPHPVAQKKPNSWGLHDMHGNVWEWVGDWFGAYAKDAQQDPQGPATGGESGRVVRGGSFADKPWDLRSAYRFWWPPERFIGFRCVRTFPFRPWPMSAKPGSGRSDQGKILGALAR